ncbi:hypothetical protein SmJEL517_g03077 [Synchytrium microbalum]|uniref:HIG1 domain-containing protein n=1 Tax=Synchytrium microbalum TaxID=1806994 RepID=A0A507C838_9FUNG|nr:uncharacterized protein SmJEL517_g03077 [Synchytrium microbalum]TPX34184.1 hypothetical protein SmJEL517_g03077 [Synchytrium microbalum]
MEHYSYNTDKENAHKKRELLRREQDSYVYTQGGKAAALFGSGAVAASFLLERISPFYHRLRIPAKAFLFAGVVTASFFTAADRAAIEVDQKFAKQYSHVDVEQIEQILEARKNAKTFKWTTDDLSEQIKLHRYKLVGGLWSGAMIGTLWYNWRRGDITTAQKVINAPLASTVTEPEEAHDPHYDLIVYGTSDVAKIHEMKAKAMILPQ